MFVLSLKAGGSGLNLTRASHVIHYDRWWNPAVENQATDRTFRICQTKDFHVHKLICAGTLEDRIDVMIEIKQETADQVVGITSERWLTELSNSELRDVLDRARASGERMGRPPALSQEQAEQCRRMAGAGAGLRQIPRVMGCSPATVKKVLESSEWPWYSRLVRIQHCPINRFRLRESPVHSNPGYLGPQKKIPLVNWY